MDMKAFRLIDEDAWTARLIPHAARCRKQTGRRAADLALFGNGDVMEDNLARDVARLAE